jgi:hypothetical protein
MLHLQPHKDRPGAFWLMNLLACAVVLLSAGCVRLMLGCGTPLTHNLDDDGAVGVTAGCGAVKPYATSVLCLRGDALDLVARPTSANSSQQ